MITAAVRTKLEREIARTENHLDALYDILNEVEKEAPKRASGKPVGRWIPLIEQSLKRVRGNRVFSVKQLTAHAQEIDSTVDRRLIYNCIKSYLQRNVKAGLFEQVNATEYKRITGGQNE